MIKSLGRPDELSKVYPDPIAHFKEETRKITLESGKARTLLVPIDTEEKMSTEEDNLKNVGYGILKYLYKELELDTFWNRRSKGRSFQYSPDRICRLLTFGRTLCPASKKSTCDARDIFYEKFDDFSLEDIYSCLDFIAENKDEEEARYDGYYSIVTSEPDRSDEKMRETYRGLARIGETFKTSKSEFSSRPVFVRTNPPIEAHFATCFLSLVLIRLLQIKLDRQFPIGQTLESLRKYCCVQIDANLFQFICYDKILRKCS